MTELPECRRHLSVTVVGTNNAPAITAGGALAYTENDPAAARRWGH